MQKTAGITLLWLAMGWPDPETVASEPAPVEPVVRLEPARERIALAPALWVLEDPSATLSYEDVTGAFRDRFRPLGTDRLNAGYSSSAFWLRLEVAAAGADSWFLELDYAPLDDVAFYARSGTGAPRVVRTGDSRPFGSRDVTAPTYVFRLPTELGDRLELHVRVRSEGTVVANTSLWRGDAFAARAARRGLIWGLYFGVMAGLALYNLFLFTVVRERAYLYYVGYLTGVSGLQAALSGYAFEYAWPGLPRLASLSPGLFLALCLSMGLLFVRQMVHVARLVPRLHRPLGVLAAAPIAVAPFLVLDYSVAVRLITGLALVTLAVVPLPILRALRQGYRPARYLALAVVVLVPAGVALALGTLGVLADPSVTVHVWQLATAAEALVLSFALADRMTLLRRAEAEAQARRLQAEQAALESQRGLSRRLIAAQDEARRRIAAELHDGLGQNILVLSKGLTRLARSEPGNGGDGETATLVAVAKQSLGELRAIARDLHPHTLDRLGLGAALTSTLEPALAAAGLDGELTVDPDIERLLPKSAQLHLYRIAQEAVANAIRHARASTVSVSLRAVEGRVALRVHDDGTGLSVDGHIGLGLTDIQERARLLLGEARFTSRPGKGLLLEVDVPAPPNPPKPVP